MDFSHRNPSTPVGLCRRLVFGGLGFFGLEYTYIKEAASCQAILHNAECKMKDPCADKDTEEDETAPLAVTAGPRQFSKTPIQRTVLKDRVSELIKDAILSGKLEAGDRIVEMKLAADLGLGTTAVR